MDLKEQKETIVKKTSEFWKKFRLYIYIGVGVIAFILGLVWVGQQYATGKADEFAAAIHQKWALDNKDTFEQITRNKIKLEELDVKFQSKLDDLTKRRSRDGKVIDATIKQGDTVAIAGMFDNLVDRYKPPTSWDK